MPILQGAIPEIISTLGGEVLAHLRSVVPGDALVAALNAARADVTTQRSERRRRRVLQVRFRRRNRLRQCSTTQACTTLS